MHVQSVCVEGVYSGGQWGGLSHWQPSGVLIFSKLVFKASPCLFDVHFLAGRTFDPLHHNSPNTGILKSDHKVSFKVQVLVMMCLTSNCWQDYYVDTRGMVFGSQWVFLHVMFFFRLQEKLFVVIITFHPYGIDGDLHVPPSSFVTIVLSRPLLTRESLALN